MFPTRIHAHGRRLGAVPEAAAERFKPSPLEPGAAVPHAQVFVHREPGGVGALQLADALHLAAGPDARAWRVAGAKVEALAPSAARPEALAPGQRFNHHDEARRAPLDALTWARVTPTPGERYVLACGVDVDPAAFADGADAADALAALPQPQPPGFFARLMGAKPQAGSVLVLDVTSDEPAPEGLLPWLAHHQQRGLEFHCWGTEGGGELYPFRQPLQGSVEATLLAYLRTDAPIDPQQLTDLYAIWEEADLERPADFHDLVEGHPERGTWRMLALDELAEVFVAADGYSGSDLRGKRVLPGTMLVERLQASVRDPVVLALHAEPHHEAVVIWFAAAGLDPESGDVVGFLSERVWS